MTRFQLKSVGPVLLVAAVVTLVYLPVLRSGTKLNFNTDFLLFASRHESVRQSLRWYGELPLRSHWFGGGFNTIADPEDPTFSPFILLSLLFGTARGLKLIGYVTMLAGALATYGFSRTVLRFTRWGALFSALVFGTCLFAPARIAGGNINEAEAAWLPLCLLLIGLAVQSGRRWPRIALAIVVYTMACDGKLSTLMAMFYIGVLALFALLPPMNVFAADDVRRRRVDYRPLLYFVTALILAVLVGAPRFFPAFEWIHNAGGIGAIMPGLPQTYDTERIAAYNFNDLWKGILGWSRPINSEMLNRDLLTVGIAPVALCVLGLLAFWRRVLPWALSLLLFIWLAMAHHAPVDLLHLSWKLPVFDAIYHPYKYFSCEIAFSIAIIGGYTFSLLRRLPSRIEASIAIVVIALSVAFLFPRAQTILARAFTYDDPALTPASAFFNVVRTGGGRRTVRAISYFNVRQNIGTLEGYSAVVISTNVAPRFFVNASNQYIDNPAYRGEVYFADAAADAGSLGAPTFKPNQIALPVQLNRPATIVINQNYDREWHADHGTVLNVNGLLAVRCDDAGAYTMQLTYRPRAFYAGLACSLTTLAALAAFGLRRRKRAPLKEEMHMRTRVIGSVFFTLAIVAATATLITAQGGGQARAGGGGRGPAVPPMLMTTTAFEDGGILPAKYAGAMGVSPALNWTQVPPGTQSLVLLLHDPEPALNKGLMDVTHWLVWNIPPTATGLPEGVPAAAERPDGSRQVSLRLNGFMGPGAPANGPYHHYTFELYALDIKLDVPAAMPSEAAATRTAVFKAMDGHILGKAILVARYHQ